MKIKAFDHEWEFDPKMDLDVFTDLNQMNYTEDYLDSHPEMWYAVNDGDLDHFRDWIQDNTERVIEDMVHLYKEFLIENYNM